MSRISAEDEFGYVFRLLEFREAMEAALEPAWDAAHNPAAFAAMVIPGPDPRPRPAWMLQEHYAQYVYTAAMDAAIVAVVGAAPAAQVAMPKAPRDVDIRPEQEDFDSLFWEILLAGGHSGYPTHATFTQKLPFTMLGMPEDGWYHEFELANLSSLFPPGVTFLNIANAHAEMIVRTAKEAKVVFEWGERHGVPSSIGFAGVPVWPHVKDRKLISEDDRETLKFASASAIRGSQSIGFRDPLVAYPEEREGQIAAANLLAERQNIQDRKAPEQLEPRARSRYTTLFNPELLEAARLGTSRRQTDDRQPR